MMSQLVNKTKNTLVASEVFEAKSFWARTKGLLGRSSLPSGHALWIHHCNSIHTWFMKFPIDVIFLDRQLKVKAVYQNVKPWRLVFSFSGAVSVVELAAGQLSHQIVEKGDLLDVRH